MFPPVVSVIPVFIMVGQLGLMDTYPALVIPYTAFNLPVIIWMLRGFVKQIPEEIEEAAQIDGSSYMDVVRRIIFPLVAPGLAAAAHPVLSVFVERVPVRADPDAHGCQDGAGGRERVHRHVRDAMGRLDRRVHHDRCARAGADADPAAAHRAGIDLRRGQVIASGQSAREDEEEIGEVNERRTMRAVLLPGNKNVTVTDLPDPRPDPARPWYR